MPMSKKANNLIEVIGQYINAAQGSNEAAYEHLFGTGAVAELEQKIADYYEMKYALLVSNATTGLFALALALDLKNDEFITSPYTYGASLASWLMLGNKPIFTDIDSQTLTLDPQKARRSVTANTRAILAVDIFGNPSDASALREIADEFGVWYIVDCAQSFGAKRNAEPASRLADALVISFTSGKTLFAGEGGAVVTDNLEIYEKLLWHTQHPYRQKRELALGVANEFAFNARIHPLAAIWASFHFEAALDELEKYQRKCFSLIDRLNESGLIETVNFKDENIFSSFFRLTVELGENISEKEFTMFLEKQKIQAKPAPVPVSVIYQTQVFLEQYGDRFSLPTPCLVAENQVKRRVCLLFDKNINF